MTSQQAMQIIRDTQVRLAGAGTTNGYGRAADHPFGPSPVRRIHVCTAHNTEAR